MDVLLRLNGADVNVIVVGSLAEAQAAFPEYECVERVAATPPASRIISKYALRQRLSLPEKIAFDNGPSNAAIPAEARVVLVSMAEDFRQAVDVDLDDPHVAQGLAFLESIGILATGRVAEILS